MQEQGTCRANEEPRRNRNSTPLALSYISFSKGLLEGVAVKALGEKNHCEDASVDMMVLTRTLSRAKGHNYGLDPTQTNLTYTLT